MSDVPPDEPAILADLATQPPLLIPRPRSLKLDPAARLASDRSEPVETTDRGLAPGGYRLEIDAEGIRLNSSDEAGHRAAKATLAQLHAQYGRTLPSLVIEDAPALAGRGVMLDVSRTRVPTNEELRSVVELLAGLKLNHLQLYTEHAFAYDGAEAVWGGSDPLTPEEVRTLDAHGRARGVELVANQNSFGHLTRWLSREPFGHLAETHGDWAFLDMPRKGPFSLCPIDDRSLRFVEGLLDQLLPCFVSPLVNIGCDETYDVGQGRSADAVAELGKGSVYGGFVVRVCESVLARAHRPMMWGDIAAEHPEVVAMLPPETIGMVWGYEPTSDFAAMGRVWRESGRAWWACPGTGSWRSYTGRSSERRANIRRAAREGVAGAAEGLLVTDWGDVGHHQVWPVAMLGIAEAADAAWTGQDRSDRDNDFLDAVSLHVFRDRTLRTARWLEGLGNADRALRETSGVRTRPDVPAALANATAMFTELHTPPMSLHLPGSPEPWAGVRDRVESLLATVPTGAGPRVADELRHAAACALFACDVALFRRGGGDGSAATGAALSDRLRELVAEHRRLWLVRSRPGGLDESVAFWDSIRIANTREG